MDIPSLGTHKGCSPLVPQWLCHHSKGTIPASLLKPSNSFHIFYFLSHPDDVSAEGTLVLHLPVPYPALVDKRATL